jgi:hypothetical protein
VKYYACLSRLIEVQAVPHDNIKKVIRSQSSITRRLNVIARNKKLLLSAGSSKDRRLRVVCTVSKKLKSQKGMSRSAFSQIDLDGVWVPFSVRANHHKIQSEASDNSFFCQTLANLCRFPRDQRSITIVGWESAS